MVDTVNTVDTLNIANTLDTVKTPQVDTKEFINSKDSLFKQTQDMISTLGDEQLKKVYVFTASLMEEDDNPFKPITKEQVLADLDESDEDIKAGRIKDAHQAMNDIRMRLGMPI